MTISLIDNVLELRTKACVSRRCGESIDGWAVQFAPR
jgi:hypothetical protein